MRIGKVLADYRYANRMGVRALAAEIGISAATMNRIELGNSCDSRSFSKVMLWLFTDESKVRRSKKP